MALPTPPPSTNPIPNNPFFAPLNPYVCGPYFPVALGNGIDLTTGATVPQLVNQVQNVLSAGPGIALTTFLGVTTITSTGGGGGAVPATPLVTGTVFGYTDGTDVDFNTSLGYCALGVGAGASAGFANVAVGICAGCAITTAYGNTLIGPGTGIAIVDGNTNTALGIGALSLTTSGFANVGIGMCSGCAYTTESGNAVFGGYFGDSGDTNTLILADGPGNLKAKFDGLGALSFDGTTYGNTGEVLLSNGAGAKPTWGPASGSPATPNTFGTVVGLVDSSANAGLGCFVLNSLTTGTDNVAIGDNALVANTTGSYNVAVGTFASSYNTTGNYNTSVGHNVFNSNTSGSYNNAFGLGTLGANTTGCCNNVMGWGALGVSDSGDSNTAIGTKAIACNLTGSFNTGVGDCSLCSMTSGCNNVGVGYQSGCNVTSGCNNVTVGPLVQVASATGDSQLAIGFSATDNWLTGDSTKAIKPGAGILDCAASTGTAGQVLMSNGANAICWGAASVPAATPTVAGTVLGCTLANNTALGCSALQAVPTGCFNTAVGASALVLTGAGNFNVGVGGFAVAANVTGCHNVGVGVNSVRNALGGNNTAVGHNTLFFATGGCNTVLGFEAGCNITTGVSNVIIGPGVQAASPTASCQLAIGFSLTDNWLTGTSTKAIRPGAGIIDCAGSCGTNGQFLRSNGSNAVSWSSALATPQVPGILLGCNSGTNTTLGQDANAFGGFNTAVGYTALCASTSAVRNVAIGASAMLAATTAQFNVAVGQAALAAGIASNGVTAVGYRALSQSTGDSNTALGCDAGRNLTTGTNNTILGFNAQAAFNASNSVTLGDTNVTVIRAAVTAITALSDARDKTDVTALPVGLDFINSLNPVKFTWRMREPNEVKDGTSEAGFIAQELLAAQQQVDADYLGLIYDQDPNRLEASAGKLLPVLVKAIQELSAKVDTLEAQLAANG